MLVCSEKIWHILQNSLEIKCNLTPSYWSGHVAMTPITDKIASICRKKIDYIEFLNYKNFDDVVLKIYDVSQIPLTTRGFELWNSDFIYNAVTLHTWP